MSCLGKLVLEGGRDSLCGTHYNLPLFLPVSLEDYKSEHFASPGRHDIPAALSDMSSSTEQIFISALISEVNVGLLAGLDPEPNHSRSSKRPAMYVGLREGGIESAILVGASHARHLSSSMPTLGVDTYKLTHGGWKLSRENVDYLIPELSEVSTARYTSNLFLLGQQFVFMCY